MFKENEKESHYFKIISTLPEILENKLVAKKKLNKEIKIIKANSIRLGKHTTFIFNSITSWKIEIFLHFVKTFCIYLFFTLSFLLIFFYTSF